MLITNLHLHDKLNSSFKACWHFISFKWSFIFFFEFGCKRYDFQIFLKQMLLSDIGIHVQMNLLIWKHFSSCKSALIVCILPLSYDEEYTFRKSYLFVVCNLSGTSCQSDTKSSMPRSFAFNLASTILSHMKVSLAKHCHMTTLQ